MSVNNHKENSPDFFSIWLTLAGFLIFSFTIVATHYGLPIYIGSLVNLIIVYVGFSVMHEAVHGNISNNNAKYKGIEKMAGYFTGFLLWVPYTLFHVLHNDHHWHPDKPGRDPDMWMNEKNIWRIIYKSLTIKVGYTRTFWENKSEKFLKLRRVVSLNSAFNWGFFLISGYMIGFYEMFIIWYVPTVLAFIVISVFWGWLPHYSGIKSKARKKDIPDCLDSRLLNIVLVGQNYHMLHHQYPQVHFRNYRHLYKKLLNN